MTTTQSSPLDRLHTIPEQGKPFRIQNRMLHLTYDGHLDFDAWIAFVQAPKPKISNGFPIAEYSMVHETSTSGYQHTHILVKFVKTVQTTNARIFDFNGVHPHIKKVTTTAHWNNVIEYHYKQGTPFTSLNDQSVISQIWSHNSVSDALLNMCESAREVGGIIAAFQHKPIDYGPPPHVDWRPWQTELMSELSQHPDDRTLNWIWDHTGCSGKSFLAKYMGMYKGAFVSCTANVYHVATQLQEFLRHGNAVLTVIFNFTRQTEEHKVYQALEQLKDGMVSSQKYKGTTLYFPCPHVVIMANYLPDITQASVDRWKIRTIANGTDFKHSFTGLDMDTWIKATGFERNRAIEIFKERLILDLLSPGDHSPLPPPINSNIFIQPQLSLLPPSNS